ncbi:MAG: hypothetical protein EOM13_00620 [Clostridia bacterium]|nr:sporulation initiation factor Spo0A C-terminal domain-containing protein [Eubacteriales bacterium]MDD3866075.1 sporulation initiation factor Spo0A C-terminal domain-containing protein [Eubacteriales bacterium]MDD4460885.1 sporulation initiation factor Spo0A C-terminal domain-containing protein [Eubacteriales bacterium]NCC47545.1 hypothetical protein [Clostridia bacterium]
MRLSTIPQDSNSKLSFYIAASDQDLLTQVSRMMDRQGLVGLMDTAGRVHYVVDGRKGSPFACRRIMDTAALFVQDEGSVRDQLISALLPVIRAMLGRYRISPELKGYRYLRHLLLLAGQDESLLRPISKTLYPLISGKYNVSISQVERDIRYALQKTELRRRGLTTTAAICTLYDEMMADASHLSLKAKPPAAVSGNRGSD